MWLERGIERIVTVPPPGPGFVGPGHLAAQVVSVSDFDRNDPFIMLADDHLDIGDHPVGEPHPHAGFETVTLILEGALQDRDEGGVIEAGEVQWMTAGRGIIHGEDVRTRGKVRLLQLWLILPREQRWTTPGFQNIPAAAIPVRQEPGVTVRIYSGDSGGLRSSTRNQVPVTIAEMILDPERSVDQEIPESYNGFIYVLEGSVRIGREGTTLEAGQVGWLDRPDASGETMLRLTSGEKGARLVLYAGQPQGHRIVSHGPFIGDTREDIIRLYREYREGRFVRMSELAHQSR